MKIVLELSNLKQTGLFMEYKEIKRKLYESHESGFYSVRLQKNVLLDLLVAGQFTSDSSFLYTCRCLGCNCICCNLCTASTCSFQFLLETNSITVSFFTGAVIYSLRNVTKTHVNASCIK